VGIPQKDALVPMNLAPMVEQHMTSVEKTAMLPKLAFRLNGKRIIPVNSRPVALQQQWKI
jgi:hypothetical protein|tara:strand:+ start:454 stop:633 length:180 start_codon:yes stop_codon:yes gene_type:complete